MGLRDASLRDDSDDVYLVSPRTFSVSFCSRRDFLPFLVSVGQSWLLFTGCFPWTLSSHAQLISSSQEPCEVWWKH